MVEEERRNYEWITDKGNCIALQEFDTQDTPCSPVLAGDSYDTVMLVQVLLFADFLLFKEQVQASTGCEHVGMVLEERIMTTNNHAKIRHQRKPLLFSSPSCLVLPYLLPSINSSSFGLEKPFCNRHRVFPVLQRRFKRSATSHIVLSIPKHNLLAPISFCAHRQHTHQTTLQSHMEVDTYPLAIMAPQKKTLSSLAPPYDLVRFPALVQSKQASKLTSPSSNLQMPNTMPENDSRH